jgi:hypothetical protein
MDVPGWSAGPTVIQRIPLYATSLRTSQASVAQTRRRMLAPDEQRAPDGTGIRLFLSVEAGVRLAGGAGVRLNHYFNRLTRAYADLARSLNRGVSCSRPNARGAVPVRGR